MWIPAHASKVHDGIIVDVYQREQEMFDGSTRTFELAKRPDSVFCVAVCGDSICMVKEQQPGMPPFIWLLWWRVDLWMSAEETMKIELSEEAGMSVESLDLFRAYEVWGKMEYTRNVYIAKWCVVDHEAHMDVAGEKIELIYVSFDEFLEHACAEWFEPVHFSHHLLRMRLDWTIDMFRKNLFTL